MMKKAWKNGTLLAGICTLCMLVLLVFQSEIKIEDWPLPLALSRIVMIVILGMLIFGIIFGCRRYSVLKKAEDAQKKAEYDRQVLLDAKKDASKAAEKKTTTEKSKKQAPSGSQESPNGGKEPFDLPKETLIDASYIAKSHRTAAGAWQQYDFLLATHPYGWDYMVSQADYMAKADLENIGTITTAELANTKETEWISQYHAQGDQIADMSALKQERGVLAIGGMSRALQFCPVKIVWFNQTRIIRVFTILDDDELLLRYVETIVRRSFGTPDAMKLAKPNASSGNPVS